MDYEVICVDDGSRDRTWELLKQQHGRDPRWRCLSFARNFGHQTAVSAGLYYATGDAVVIIDADLQDPPEEISRLIEKWREGFEVVFATRKKRQDPLSEKISRLGLLPAAAKDDAAADGRATPAISACSTEKCVAVMNALPERNRYLRGLRTWCGFRQTSVEFDRAGRAAGVPQYTFKKSFKLAMDGLFSFSAAPLRLATYLGLWVSASRFLARCSRSRQKVFAATVCQDRPRARPARIPDARDFRSVPRRRAADLPGHPRRIHRPHLRRGQGPAALDHPRQRRTRLRPAAGDKNPARDPPRLL